MELRVFREFLGMDIHLKGTIYEIQKKKNLEIDINSLQKISEPTPKSTLSSTNFNTSITEFINSKEDSFNEEKKKTSLKDVKTISTGIIFLYKLIINNSKIYIEIY